jgi:hypothetical protein
LPQLLPTCSVRLCSELNSGDKQQQQQLSRKVSAALPDSWGTKERCKSNVSLGCSCSVQVSAPLAAGRLDVPCVRPPRFLRTHLGYAPSPPPPCPARPRSTRDKQQQQQLSRKVSAALPDSWGTKERCKSNVSLDCSCSVQVSAPLAAGRLDMPCVRPPRFLRTHLGYALPPPPPCPSRPRSTRARCPARGPSPACARTPSSSPPRTRATLAANIAAHGGRSKWL